MSRQSNLSQTFSQPMPQTQRTYIAIDLKSFYASVECIERGLDPLGVNLVVADASRTEKTICLSVTPTLKAYGISGRARLFEVNQRLREVNALRLREANTLQSGKSNSSQRGVSPMHKLSGKSIIDSELKAHKDWAVDYIAAPPRMAYYIEYSTRIYKVYLKYVAAEDIHVYSIDEVFMDVTNYLGSYKMSAHELAQTIIHDVLQQTGITATAGIGPNLYLCKVAMDIVAKHIPPDRFGVRIAELDEMSYRKQLWNHQPLTDFWRVGRGIAEKLNYHGIYTMGQLARCSKHNEELLYRLFGVNAELLIDHAWGWEPCRIADIKAYKPETNSLSNGQVLHEPYTCEKARVILQEMADGAVLDLVEKHLVTNQIVITIGYDIDNLTNPEIARKYRGEITTDWYGRSVPKHSHGTTNLKSHCSSTRIIIEAALALYDRIVNPALLIRRLNFTVNNVIDRTKAELLCRGDAQQLDLFTDYQALEEQKAKETAKLEKEKRMQEAVINIKRKFGKNSILKGLNFEEGATAKDRNQQIGGHKA